MDPHAVIRMTGRSGFFSLDLLQEIEAFIARRLPGKIHILQHQLIIVACDHLKRLSRSGGRTGPIAGLFQHQRQRRHYGLIIIDYEDHLLQPSVLGIGIES